MTYSCAVWDDPDETARAGPGQQVRAHLRQAGAASPVMRLLDVGCGWGGMLIHAARHHGVSGVGITLSQRAARATPTERVTRPGLDDRIEIRVQDYREIDDGPFDAISSIGMFEHVGPRRRWTPTSAVSTGCCARAGAC